MPVEVEIFGQLAPDVERLHSLTLEIPVSVKEVAELLGVVPKEVGLVTIDGVQELMDSEVPLDCRLCFFPPMTGG